MSISKSSKLPDAGAGPEGGGTYIFVPRYVLRYGGG